MRQKIVWQQEAAKYMAEISRVQVWDAFSELFLDTSRTAEEYQWLAQIIAETDFSYQELAHIAFIEVGPVCLPNSLMWLGGEGMGFSPHWLIPRCSERQTKHPFKLKGNPNQLPLSLSFLVPVFFQAYELLNQVKLYRQKNLRS